VVSEPRPEQRPAADRIFRKWGDIHRINHLEGVLRRMAFQAAVFDSTPSPAELVTLAGHLDKAEEAIAQLQGHLDDLARDIHDLAAAVNGIQADREAGKPEFSVLGFDSPEAALKRLERLYRIEYDRQRDRLKRE